MFGFIAFLKNSLLDSASLRKRNNRGLAASDNENITQSCGEDVALGILNSDNVEGTIVLLNVHESTNSSTVITLSGHDHGTQVEFENIGHFSGRNGDLDGIVDLDIRVGVSDSPSVVGDNAGDLVGTNEDFVDPTELELSFFSVNSVQYVTSLNVVHQTEAVVCLLQFYNIHETGREAVVGADLSVNLDATFHANLHGFFVGQRVLKALTKDDTDGQAFTELVGASGRTAGPDTSHLSEVPVPRGIEPLHMLFRSASPVQEKRERV